ncbi:hypothetical protein CNMCM6069_008955 [Aspergillus lentulus]|uniref:Zn(2)-C6 fungal-type domain-containing protein n=2 Tax=Aspergillus lentulus TaxID=293939 RepID=A0ABQ1AFU0_ASPLE|nr:hypothetical protein CNMCM6069_008955 [Aspergillus lentulus]KAF4182988.1 hypothetical protein CNMCM7927_009365 [Aspergillus lentulus]GFF80984.1 hypothetical protein IFM60648_05889 [Aspergillus lentulus]GFF85352.1 hypothetical protein IFM47457_06787 [Aspergillus lentulus]
MPLKRGLERVSCDFCHRRKVKCDRLLRARQGMTACSQCALRDIQCHVDDSDDVRIRRRRQTTARGGIVRVGTGGTGDLQPALSRPSPGVRGDSASQVASESHFVSPSPGNDNAALSNIPFDIFDDSPFALSFDNMLFLDQVFMGNCGPVEENNQRSQDSQNPTSTSEMTQTDSQEQDGKGLVFLREELGTSPWMGASVDSALCTAALRSYFDYAAPYLPILLADAFWEDYHANRCSELLLYAVACRGMPFIEAPDKWNLQQRLAAAFRERYLSARSNTCDNETIRIDDLEAFALMIGFEYDDSGSLPLLSNLGRLFLTHDSLVLMTTNYHILDHDNANSTLPTKLARARERRVLLYWHIYGLDAFHCLDKKQMSRIPNNDVGSSENLSLHETKDYFDALLALAVIAHQLTQTLCRPFSKREGVILNDIHNLYEQLDYWRDHCCPPHLRRYTDSAGRPNPIETNEPNSSRTGKYIHLYRAVLWALELHCRLMVEDCVSEFGLQDRTSLEAEVLARRVEYESLRTLNEMVNICQWMTQHDTHHEDHKRLSLIDLAPNILRNICAGMCYWSCQRGIDLCDSRPPRLLQSRHANDREETLKQKVLRCMEIAQLLRDAAATATSHRDTAHVLERIEKQRELLDSRSNLL